MTTAPERPRIGQRITVHATGFVGEAGHLWLYRTAARSCPDTQRAARTRATRLLSRPLAETFEAHVSFRPSRARREWICGYLYSNACEAGGSPCAPAVGLPPDAGFARVPIRVRPRR